MRFTLQSLAQNRRTPGRRKKSNAAAVNMAITDFSKEVKASQAEVQ